MMETKKISFIACITAFLLLGGLFALRLFIDNNSAIGTADLHARVQKLEQDVTTLSENIQNQFQQLSNQTAETSRALQELKSEITINVPRSQEEILTDAVANATPSVVSIVVSKDVPQLEIEYINPFGDDPYFRDFGFRTPVYRQKGIIEQQIGAGTGFLVSRNGHIVTNRHVVAETDAHFTVLLWSGAQKTATVAYRDSTHDIAILKIDGSYTSLTLGNSASVKLGQSVVAIGNALGEFNNSVSTGIISGLNRTIEASDGRTAQRIENVIQTDAAINRGNSGGPLIDLNGNAIGINVATVLGSNNISFAIPINTVKTILQKVL